MIDRLLEFYQEWYVGPVSTIMLAIIILLVGFILGKLFGRATTRVLHELELNSLLGKAGINIQLEKVIGGFVSWFIYFVAIIMALSQFKIATTILYIVAVAIMAVVTIAIVLMIRDFFPNIFAGLVLYKDGFIKVGDKIEIGTTKGTVMEISLLKTWLKTKSGDTIYIPNSTITKNQVIKLKR